MDKGRIRIMWLFSRPIESIRARWVVFFSLWPDISRVGRVTSHVFRGMGVTQFIGVVHIARIRIISPRFRTYFRSALSAKKTGEKLTQAGRSFGIWKLLLTISVTRSFCPPISN